MSLAEQGKKNRPQVQGFDEVGLNEKEQSETTVTKAKVSTEPKQSDIGINNSTEEEVNNDINTEPTITTVDDIFNDIINKPKEKPKKQVSIYLEEDVARAFEKFGKKYGKGAKSELINSFLKSKLIQQ